MHRLSTIQYYGDAGKASGAYLKSKLLADATIGKNKYVVRVDNESGDFGRYIVVNEIDASRYLTLPTSGGKWS